MLFLSCCYSFACARGRPRWQLHRKRTTRIVSLFLQSLVYLTPTFETAYVKDVCFINIEAFLFLNPIRLHYCQDGKSLFSFAAEKNNAHAIRSLIAQGADVAIADQNVICEIITLYVFDA